MNAGPGVCPNNKYEPIKAQNVDILCRSACGKQRNQLIHLEMLRKIFQQTPRKVK